MPHSKEGPQLPPFMMGKQHLDWKNKEHPQRLARSLSKLTYSKEKLKGARGGEVGGIRKMPLVKRDFAAMDPV